MSAKLMGSVYEVELSHPQQAVLLAMADHAQDDGTDVFPSIGRLAWKTGYDDRQVKRIIKDLRAAGVLIEVVPPAQHRPTEYRIDLGAATKKPSFEGKKPRGDISNRGDTANLRGDKSDSRGDKSDPPGVTPRPPEPSVEPSTKPSRRAKRKVNRKAVSDDELVLTAAVVSQFNSSAGTGLSVDAHLTPIVGRIREKPDYTEAHHRAIIEAVFAGEHWWTSPPTPKIIYGNPAIFEQSIELARAQSKRRRDAEDPNAERERVQREFKEANDAD